LEATSVKLIAWLALGVSIYAALVATIVGSWTVYGIWRDRSSIRIVVRYGYIRNARSGPYLRVSTAFKRDEVSENTRPVITARNTGRRPVLLSQGGFRYRSSTQHAFTGEGWDKQYPIRLEEGQSGDTWTSLKSMQVRLKREGIKPPIWAYFQTESGKTYKSKVPRRMARVLFEGSAEGIQG
jgi:hypothetical protein